MMMMMMKIPQTEAILHTASLLSHSRQIQLPTLVIITTLGKGMPQNTISACLFNIVCL